MNCKQGDLAIYVGKISPMDNGAIVRCVRFLGDRNVYGGGLAPMWEIDPPLKNSPANRKEWASDRSLRPIRDNDGEDETLQWAPVPTKETA